MNYINAEQFQEQTKEVQEVLLKWWKPQEDEIFIDEADMTLVECIDYINAIDEIDGELVGAIYHTHRDNMSEKDTMIPLLTEGQLRDFIEEKVGEIIEIGLYCGGYSIVTAYRNHEYEILGDNLLQAYWKVACQIAEEVLMSKYFSLKITYRELCILKHALRDKVEQKEKTGDYDFYIRMLKENENSITDRGKKELKEHQEEKEALDSITKCVEEVQAYIGKQEDV